MSWNPVDSTRVSEAKKSANANAISFKSINANVNGFYNLSIYKKNNYSFISWVFEKLEVSKKCGGL